ncbi:ABC transporter ATP-binding protein [Enemella evansiae]|uniref:ABC transporter ATP-binding protein n=1 Tax=Enemella evansiae TaxID=2016499 RepID=UPI000C00C5F5|nr:ABC transporter ATP-binding protein [Enemella evansiae]PFG67891.1 amino acid/amide ABC transporter ATP-binding protein 1, HAAT family [Propionibacteriaceae bacterium ES.041]
MSTAIQSERPERPDLSNAEVLLSAEQVTMQFGGLTAVNKVDLKVHNGEIMGLIGPNGAGKTTFFNCLTGLYQPTSGRVMFNGSVLPPKPRKVVMAGMARTFQNIRLFHNMTALENVMVGRYSRTRANAMDAILRLPRHRREERETRERAHELLEFVGLGKVADSLSRNLSYGDQRRLEIARALATDPQLLLLDEPTAGMNPQETRQAEELIFRIRDLGLAVLVIEHDMRFIFNLCDRVCCLVRGEVLVEGTAHEVQSDPRVIEAYIGSAENLEESLAEEGLVPPDGPVPQQQEQTDQQRHSGAHREGERDA